MHAGQRLNEIKSTAVYPKGAMLFIEGQQPRGVFVLCAGKAKLSTSSREGKTIITKLSDAGDVLGLNSVVSNRPYEVSAEMMEPGQANFIPRESLVQFLKDHGEVALRVAEQLSRNYYTAYEEIRTLGLATSPSEKFAKLLLSWSTKTTQGDGSSQVKLTLTHEEIAEIIGTTRETVSRLFSEFKKAAAAVERVDAADSKSTCFGKNCAVLRAADLRVTYPATVNTGQGASHTTSCTAVHGMCAARRAAAVRFAPITIKSMFLFCATSRIASDRNSVPTMNSGSSWGSVSRGSHFFSSSRERFLEDASQHCNSSAAAEAGV